MDQDLKDTIKKLEEAKSKQEKIERIIILLSGLLIVIIFSIIGINIYSNREETISEPEINIIANSQPSETPLKKTDIQQKQQPEVSITTKEKDQTPPVKKEKEEEKKEAKSSQKPVATKKVQKEKPPAQKEKAQSFRSGYYIQAGAFTTRKKAEKLLKALNIPNAKIRKEGQLYKVLIGDFKNRKEAYSFMKKMGIKGFIRKI